jgi:hypothetical protein
MFTKNGGFADKVLDRIEDSLDVAVAHHITLN